MSLQTAAQVYRETMRQTVKRYSLWYLVEGGLLVVAGALAILFPLISSTAVVFMLGWLLIISGLLQGLSLIGARAVPHFWMQLVSVVLALLIGFLILRDPIQSLLTISLLVIVFLMVEGISKIVFALSIRPLANWGWVMLSGLVGVLMSLILIGSFPLSSIWLLGVLFGIQLMSVGASMAYMAWHIRRA